MTDKNKLTTADLIIAKHFGEASAEFYGDDYKKLDKHLKENKIEDIEWFESKKDPEFAKKAAEKFAPLVAEIAEKNRKSKAAFARLKELVSTKPSIREIIESTEKGVEGVLTSVKNDIIDVLNYLSTPNGLAYIPASSATRSHQELSESFKEKGDMEVTFKLIAGDNEYDCMMKREDDNVIITIKCEDTSKEFFITGNGYAESGKPVDGLIRFSVPDQGEYIISVEGEFFRAISLQ
ncbi:MAG TPA: hypothetical protein P5120_17025 [Spirochaetota bacterium]|nr:hypothetical protein [Spirochaetota bacterium]